MEARYYYFTVHSARDLVDVRTFGEMKVYAKVTMAGESKYTEVDVVNKTNPEWNTKLCFLVPEKDIERGKINAFVELFCQRSLSDDKYVGELNLMLPSFNKGTCNFSVDRNNSNRTDCFGTLKFSHELGDKVLVVQGSPSSSSRDYAGMAKALKIGMEIVNCLAEVIKN